MAGDPVKDLEGILGHEFSDRDLLERALTHGSFLEGGEDRGRSYQVLEFLGDAVLELLAREYLLKKYPDEPEGSLTRRKIGIVRKENLAEQGLRLGLDRLARVGSGFVATPEARRSLAADMMESILGAVYLDAGISAAEEIAGREILERSAGDGLPADPRSRLQEYCQSAGMDLPVYITKRRTGPDHRPLFTVTVSMDGEESGTGTGRTRKAAAEKAAAEALESIERMV